MFVGKELILFFFLKCILAFIGALYVDKDITWVERFCQVCFWPRLVEFILKQEWNDPKSKLQQCCLTFRSLNEDPELAHYKVMHWDCFIWTTSFVKFNADSDVRPCRFWSALDHPTIVNTRWVFTSGKISWLWALVDRCRVQRWMPLKTRWKRIRVSVLHLSLVL